MSDSVSEDSQQPPQNQANADETTETEEESDTPPSTETNLLNTTTIDEMSSLENTALTCNATSKFVQATSSGTSSSHTQKLFASKIIQKRRMDVVIMPKHGEPPPPTLSFMSSSSPSNKLFAQENHKEVWLHELASEDWPAATAKRILKNIAIFKMKGKLYLAHQCLFSSKHKCNCLMFHGHILIAPRVMPRENLNHLVLADVALTFYNIFAFAVRNDAEICFAKLGGKELCIPELREYVYETNHTAHSIDVKMQLKLARVCLPTKADDSMRRYNEEISVELTPVLVGNLTQLSEKAMQTLSRSKETELSDIFKQFLWMFLPVPASRYQHLEQFKSSMLVNTPIKEINEAIQKFQTEIYSFGLQDILDKLGECGSLPHYDPNSTYMKPIESAEWLRKWAQFQFGDTWQQELIFHFQFMERKTGKVGTLN